MALTFTSGMTTDQDATAEVGTNWAIARISGSGQSPSSALSVDIFKQGSACMSAKISVKSTDAVLCYDYYTDHSNAVLDLSTGNKHVAMWVLLTTPTAIKSLANGGMYVLLQSSAETGTTAPTVYSKWYIRGASTYEGGWIRVIIDPTKAASITGGGGVSLSGVRRIGVGLFTTDPVPTVRSENLFVDSIAWGKPVYKVVGDGATTATWADFISDSKTKANGLIQDIGGVYALSAGIRFGDSAQSNTTTFADATGKQFLWKRHTYYEGGATKDVVDYPNIYLIDAQGTGTNKTSVTLGQVVGTLDDRQGVLGGGIRSPDTTNLTWKMDFQTNKSSLSAVKIYGLDIVGAKGGLLFDNNAGGTETSIISCGVINCGELDPGTTGNGAEILSCAIIDPLGGTNNRGIRIPATHNIKKISCITSGAPATQHMTHIPDGGTYEVAYDGVKVFGNYSSGTLWHGESSANTGTITVSATNGANPTTAEFNKTGTPGTSVTVQNQKTLTLTGIQSGSEVRVFDESDNSSLAGAETQEGALIKAVINTGGTGYTVDDILTISGGTSSVAAQVKVTAVSSGVITGVTIETPGGYSINPNNPASVTGGTGSGAKFDLTFGGTFTYQFPVGSVIARAFVFHKNYVEVNITGIALDGDRSIPIQQKFDRVYDNP